MAENKTFDNHHFKDHREAIPFSGSPLDRLDEYRENPVWLKEKRNSILTKFIFFHEGKSLMKIKPKLELGIFSRPQFSLQSQTMENFVLLGGYGEEVWFAINVEKESDAPIGDDFKWIDVRSVANQLSADDMDNGRIAIIGGAVSMLNWHGAHGFCAKCGHETNFGRAGYVRNCINLNCKVQHFPRTDPVVIMLATKGDKCLLGRSPHHQDGVYSVLAGFMEPGESIEEGVRRELMEEAGIKVGVVNYIKSQPWPFPSSLMIGCIADALTDEIIFQDGELEDAKWFTRKEIIEILRDSPEAKYKAPTKISIAHHLLKYWVG